LVSYTIPACEAINSSFSLSWPSKQAGAKMEDPDRDMGAQYEKKKAEEKLKD
jgi:hypothetical protein